jgi:hypothetical protein
MATVTPTSTLSSSAKRGSTNLEDDYNHHHNQKKDKVSQCNDIDHIPMVIKSMIISYLSFRSYLTIMRLNHSWRSASLRTESKCPYLQSSSFMISSSSNDGQGWLNQLVTLAPKTLILSEGIQLPLQLSLDDTKCGIDAKMLSSLHRIGETLTSLTVDILTEAAAVTSTSSTTTGRSGGVRGRVDGSDNVWCSNLTSLSLRTETPNGDHDLVKWLPKLADFHGIIHPDSILVLPLSLTSLQLSRLSPTRIIEIIDHLPLLTHLYVNGMGHYDGATDDQRRRLIHHPTLASLGGDIWDINPSRLQQLVGSASLSHLKCIDVPHVEEELTYIIMKVAPNLTQIDYQLSYEGGEENTNDAKELHSLGKMKSLTNLKLVIHDYFILPLLVPNVSHVLKDLIISGPFTRDNIPFESFRGLTQLTSLTFYMTGTNAAPVIWFDAFASIGLPLLPFITLSGQLNHLLSWKSLIPRISNCGHRRIYFPTTAIARLWKPGFDIEQSCIRILGNGIYPCHPSPICLHTQLQPVIIDHDDHEHGDDEAKELETQASNRNRLLGSNTSSHKQIYTHMSPNGYCFNITCFIIIIIIIVMLYVMLVIYKFGESFLSSKRYELSMEL